LLFIVPSFLFLAGRLDCEDLMCVGGYAATATAAGREEGSKRKKKAS
jgi:hypothetical protein